MLLEMQRSEVGLWAALYKVNPWGENRADYRAALGHALFAERYRDRSMRQTPYAPRDFMPYATPTPAERELELQDKVREALSGLEGGRRGAEFKAWRSAQRRRVGNAK